MRIFSLLFFLLAAGCGTLGHALDDLKAVHTEPPAPLTHRFEVERFGAFGSFMSFGVFGQILGPLRYEKRSKETLEDPSTFCAERVRIVGQKGPGSGIYALESVLWTGRVLLSDPYTLSRVFACEALERLGKEFLDANAWERALDTSNPDYADRAKLVAEELSKLVALQDKAGPEDRALIRKDLAELASQHYSKPAEDLAILRMILGVASGASSEQRDACEEAGRHLVARTIPRLLLAGLRDPNEFVREGSVLALHDLYGRQAFGETLRSLRTETSNFVRRRLAKLCGELSLEEARDPKNGGALDFLIKATHDADGSVAASAMESLSKILKIPPRWDREFWRAWGEEYLLRGVPPEIRS